MSVQGEPGTPQVRGYKGEYEYGAGISEKKSCSQPDNLSLDTNATEVPSGCQ